jgi:hypothetical protein
MPPESATVAPKTAGIPGHRFHDPFHAPSVLLAAYLSAHRTVINGSAHCAAWLSPTVKTLLA